MLRLAAGRRTYQSTQFVDQVSSLPAGDVLVCCHRGKDSLSVGTLTTSGLSAFMAADVLSLSCIRSSRRLVEQTLRKPGPQSQACIVLICITQNLFYLFIQVGA